MAPRGPPLRGPGVGRAPGCLRSGSVRRPGRAVPAAASAAVLPAARRTVRTRSPRRSEQQQPAAALRPAAASQRTTPSSAPAGVRGSSRVSAAARGPVAGQYAAQPQQPQQFSGGWDTATGEQAAMPYGASSPTRTTTATRAEGHDLYRTRGGVSAAAAPRPAQGTRRARGARAGRGVGRRCAGGEPPVLHRRWRQRRRRRRRRAARVRAGRGRRRRTRPAQQDRRRRARAGAPASCSR